MDGGNLLLDTHALIWWAAGDKALGRKVARLLEAREITVFAWPQEHGDPFDRLLAAQSDLENIPLATNDPRIKTFGVRTIW